MKIEFRRIISSGEYIPQVDGLRFVAILSVVFFHLHVFLRNKLSVDQIPSGNFSLLHYILSKGEVGVLIFFVLSGFILGKPFADHFLNGKPPPSLTKFYWRRLTRLEPPYMACMVGLFFGAVFFAKTLTFQEALRSLLASLTYTHNLWYGREVLPLLNGVAWSLEIEIQFYLLLPVFSLILKIKDDNKRRLVWLILALVSILVGAIIHLPFISLLNYLHYFMMGLFLADLYASRIYLLRITKFDGFFSFLALGVIGFTHSNNLRTTDASLMICILQLAAIFMFCYWCLFHKAIKALAYSWITNIGGMCYSIYLLHYAIISLVGNYLLKFRFFDLPYLNIAVYVSALLIIIAIFSTIYFLLLERPSMQYQCRKANLTL